MQRFFQTFLQLAGIHFSFFLASFFFRHKNPFIITLTEDSHQLLMPVFHEFCGNILNNKMIQNKILLFLSIRIGKNPYDFQKIFSLRTAYPLFITFLKERPAVVFLQKIPLPKG